MAAELEIKLAASNSEILKEILCDPKVSQYFLHPVKVTKMRTTYYDTFDRQFSSRKWALRQRYEDDASVVTLKTPLSHPFARNEYEISHDALDQSAIEALIHIGAPEELRTIFGDGSLLQISAGAEFTRTHTMLQFKDGSRAELACDQGILCGSTETCTFCEVELELYDGSQNAMTSLADYLCSTFSLWNEPRSKFARARLLK